MAEFNDIISRGLRLVRQCSGVACTYRRGNGSQPSDILIQLVNVATGKRAFKYIDASGMSLRQETRDYLVDADQMADTVPTTGDQIDEEIRGYLETYEVAAINGEDCWLPSDSKKTALRIHTTFLRKVPL